MYLLKVCLSFGIHHGLSVIPKSSNSSRMAENLKYVRLDEEDIRRLTEIDRNLRLLPVSSHNRAGSGGM